MLPTRYPALRILTHNKIGDHCWNKCRIKLMNILQPWSSKTESKTPNTIGRHQRMR